MLRKLRQTQQMALVGLLRNQDVATSLGYLARVYARLEGLCREAPLGPLWSIASGLVEGLANGSVVNSASVRTLLRQLDRELKRLVEQGADGLNQAAPDELVKNLLFYVAKAPSQSPRIRALKEQYRLDEALPDHETVDAERARLAGPDRDAMRSVVGALCEELVRIKDSLDLFVRSDRGHPSELDALLAPLKQIADTLAVLGFGQPRKVILDQLDVIHALAQGRREPSDAILMDVAGALLYVEATLAGMAGPGDERNSEESRLPTTDVAQIHQLVIKEARNGLEQAKDAIIEFIASQWNHEHLARVPELLTQVRGGLAMIPLERAATLLETCNRYIQEQLLARKAVPDWQSLDTLADAITSVEYYLERLSEDHASQSDLILDVAEDSLANLGYTLKPNSSAPAEPGLSGPLPSSPLLPSRRGRRRSSSSPRQRSNRPPTGLLPRPRGKMPRSWPATTTGPLAKSRPTPASRPSTWPWTCRWTIPPKCRRRCRRWSRRAASRSRPRRLPAAWTISASTRSISPASTCPPMRPRPPGRRPWRTGRCRSSGGSAMTWRSRRRPARRWI